MSDVEEIQQRPDEAMVREFAGLLRAWQLGPLALVLLEAHRPLAFVLAQLCHVLAPFAVPWHQASQALRLGTMLGEDARTLERLMTLLEEQGEGP